MFAEFLSSITHLGAALLFAMLYFPLMNRAADKQVRFGVTLYSFSVVFLMLMSGIFHAMPFGTNFRYIFWQLDHAAIWVFIAGTYTPCHIIMFKGWWRTGYLTIIWAIALSGIMIKALYIHEIPRSLNLVMFGFLGVLGIISALRYISVHGFQKSQWLWAGGLIYGVAGYLNWQRWPVIDAGFLGSHEIFHMLIVFGAIFHWVFIYEKSALNSPIYEGRASKLILIPVKPKKV